MAQINSGFKAELKVSTTRTHILQWFLFLKQKQSRELSRLREHDTRKSELEKELSTLKKSLKDERRQRE